MTGVGPMLLCSPQTAAFNQQASDAWLPAFTSSLSPMLGSSDTCAVTSTFAGVPNRKR